MGIRDNMERDGAPSVLAAAEALRRAGAPSSSEVDELRRAVAELRTAQEEEAARNTALRRELASNQELVAKLMGGGKTDLDRIAWECNEKRKRDARRALYQAVRDEPVTIVLNTHEDPNRNFPLHVSLNGEVHEIPRGTPYTLPGRFLEVLDEARVLSSAREVNDSGNPVTKLYDYLSYPYAIVRGADERLVAAAQ